MGSRFRRCLFFSFILFLTLGGYARIQAQPVRMPAASLRAWIEQHPTYQRILTEPDSAEKRLFLYLAERASNFAGNTRVNEIPQVILPGQTQEEHLLLLLAYTIIDLQSEWSQIRDPIIGGQLLALQQAAAISNQSSTTKLEIEIAQRFVLAARAMGYHSLQEIQNIGSRITIDDLMVKQDIQALGPNFDRKRKASELISRMVIVGLPLETSSRLNPLWTGWDVFNSNHYPPSLNGQSVPPSLLEMLFFQRSPAPLNGELRRQQSREFGEQVLREIDLPTYYAERWARFTPAEQSGLQEVVRWALETRPANADEFVRAVRSSSFTTPKTLSLKDWKLLYQEIIFAAAKYTSAARPSVERELSANVLESRLREWKMTDEAGQDPVPFFDPEDSFLTLLAGEFAGSILAGQNRAPASEEVLPTYLQSSAQKMSLQGFGVLGQSFSYIQNQAEIQLRRSLSEIERTQLSQAFAEVIRLRIEAGRLPWTDLIAHHLSEESKKVLQTLQVYPDVLPGPWSILVKPPNADSSTLPSEPVLQMKRTLMRALGFRSEKALAQRLAQSMIDRPYPFIHEFENSDDPLSAYEPIRPGLPLGTARFYYREAERAAIAFVHHHPETAEEFHRILNDAKTMRTLTGDGILRHPPEITEDLFKTFVHAMGQLIEQYSCSELLKKSRDLIAR